MGIFIYWIMHIIDLWGNVINMGRQYLNYLNYMHYLYIMSHL